MQLAAILVTTMTVALASHVIAQSAHESTPSKYEIELPLHEGRLEVGDLFARLSKQFGINDNNAITDVEWSIDVRSAVGKVQLHLLDRLASGTIDTHVEQDRVIVSVDRQRLKDKLLESGRTVEDWLADLTGRAKVVEARRYGMTLVTAENDRLPLAEIDALPKRLVILVHGLDDPGFMWNDLIPELRLAGYEIARFEYPNDGPVSEAADLLAAELEACYERGMEQVDVVGHSMGGLVARDVLTRTAYYNGDGQGGNRFPSMDRLIMLGTPNHGSKMVRLRGITELGESLIRALTGESQLNSTVGDGSGEAGIDLLPESDFLRRLNGRPLPTHTRMTIVAGKWLPVNEKDAADLIESAQRFALSNDAPQWLRDLASKDNQELASSMMGNVINGLGDGCVTIESARLEGIDDFVIVQANHVDMLFTVMPTDKPSAIPIVLDRLARP